MNPPELNPWVVYLIGLITLGKLIWELFTKPGSRAQEAVDGLKEKVAEKAEKAEVVSVSNKVQHIEERLAGVERDVAHLPDKDSAHRLELAISKLEGRFDTLDERLKPVAAMASRFQDFLVEEARPK